MKSIAYPSIAIISALAGMALCSLCDRKRLQAHRDHELRDSLSEKQIDNMVKDSFPASDPPSTY